MAWVALQVGWFGFQKIIRVVTKSDSQVNGDSEMVLACWLYQRRAQKINETSDSTFV